MLRLLNVISYSAAKAALIPVQASTIRSTVISGEVSAAKASLIANQDSAASAEPIPVRASTGRSTVISVEESAATEALSANQDSPASAVQIPVRAYVANGAISSVEKSTEKTSLTAMQVTALAQGWLPTGPAKRADCHPRSNQFGQSHEGVPIACGGASRPSCARDGLRTDSARASRYTDSRWIRQ